MLIMVFTFSYDSRIHLHLNFSPLDWSNVLVRFTFQRNSKDTSIEIRRALWGHSTRPQTEANQMDDLTIVFSDLSFREFRILKITHPFDTAERILTKRSGGILAINILF